MATRNELIREVRNNFAHINAEYIGIDYEQLNSMRVFRQGFTKLTFTKGKKRGVATGNLSKMNKTQLQNILNYQKKFFANPYTTAESRERIFEQAQQTSMEKYGLNALQYAQAHEAFTNIMSDKLFNKFMGSEQIIDIVKHGGKVADLIDIREEFINAYNNKLSFDENEEILQKIIQEKGF